MKKTIKTEQKASKKTRKRSENIIPDYEFLFAPDKHTKSKKSSSFFSRVLRLNLSKIIVSSLIYILKTSPVWVLPIITANIINIAQAPPPDALKKIAINGLILAVLVLQNIPTHTIYAKITDKMIRNTSAGIKSTVIRKLQSLSITYHKEIESGKIQSKFIKDTDAIDGLFGSIIRSVIPNIIGVVIAIGIALYKSGTVSLFFLVVIPINVMLSRTFLKNHIKRNRRLRKENENMSAKLTNMLDMLAVTKAHGLEDEEISSFQQSIKSLIGAGLSIDRANAFFGASSWVLNTLLTSACLIFCAILAVRGDIMVGDIVLYQSLFVSISNYIVGLVNVLPQISSGFESVYSLSEIMLSDDVELNTGKYKPVQIEGALQFEGVSYKYPNSRQYVIKNFNLDVRAGESIALVGASGSGKSTIMNMIIGFLKPLSGDLKIDGKSIHELDLVEYRRHISVVSQNTILFSGTLRENITYGMTNYTEEELNEVIEKANLTELIKELPQGLDTHIGEHGGKLSGGQKQRVTIARALIRNPRILILDEATSALDNISEYHVQRAISSSIKDRTTFIVAHRLSTIRDADRIIVMEQGICVEQGTFDELLEKKGKFYELKSLNDLNTGGAACNFN